MDGTLARLRVEIDAGADSDGDELAELSAGLRDELLELDVDAVEPVTGGVAPRGAKGVGADTAGTLLVNMSDSAVVVALAGVLRSWVSRGRNRKLTIRLGEDVLEVTRASAEDQAKLIASWLDSHARK